MEYAKTNIPEFLSVSSIMTVHRIELAGKSNFGEAHDFPEIIYIAEGTHAILVDNERFELSAGQMLIYAPGAYHIGERESNASIYIISFEATSDILSELYNRVITLDNDKRTMLTDMINGGAKLFERVSPDSGLVGMTKKPCVTDYDLQILRNKLELLLIDIYYTKSHKQNEQKAVNHENLDREQFEAVTAYLREHIGEALTLEEIAASSHISVSKLSALFRDQCGCGTIAYFNSIKIERAKRLIRDSSMNFTQISQSLGFCTVHYFSKLFKKIAGITPTEYARTFGRK
ncbi:MAG: helix-turn-helix transcriptional regulator [Clostridia bacterium]|nr:helix-turn-helix transcriptional regulator [Clostridia bacterium]